MPLWDDPLKIAAVILSALILLVALINLYKNHKVKKLSYNILTNTAIAPIDTDLSKKIKLFYEESADKLIPIKDSRLIIIKFSNDGKEPIKRADFEEPISISFTDTSIHAYTSANVHILDKDVIEYPDSLKKPELSISGNTLILEPLLLNKNDFITIKVFLANSKEKPNIKIRARIIDIKDIKKIAESENISGIDVQTKLLVLIFIFIIIIGCVYDLISTIRKLFL